jgi:hypothetical protein
VADESGAKGYSGTAERFPGELGIFAGLIIPESLLQTLSQTALALQVRFANGGKFHIADVAPNRQEELRSEVLNVIQTHQLVCVYEAIYVAGFFLWYEKQRQLIEKVRAERRSPIKISSNLTEESLHDHLFQGLIGKAIAWCEGHYDNNYHLTVLLDNVDKPILRSFMTGTEELLGGWSYSRPVTGFDPQTKTVVRGRVEGKVTIPEQFRLSSGKTNVTIAPNGKFEELSIFPDVLSNWLNYYFKEKNKTHLGVPPNRRATLNGFPLRDRIFGFSDDCQSPPVSERLFCHPNVVQEGRTIQT